jgi:hypothetical protein
MKTTNMADNVTKTVYTRLMSETSYVSPPPSLKPSRKLGAVLDDVMIDDFGEVVDEVIEMLDQEIRADIMHDLILKVRMLKLHKSIDFTKSSKSDPILTQELLQTIDKYLLQLGNYSILIVGPIVLTILQSEGKIIRDERETSFRESFPYVGRYKNTNVFCDPYAGDNDPIIVAGTRWVSFPESGSLGYDFNRQTPEGPMDPAEICRFTTSLIPMIDPAQLRLIGITTVLGGWF